MTVVTYPICPRCDKPVYPAEEHELLLELVNRDPVAPEEHTKLHAKFHMKCAAQFWTAARAEWHGEVPVAV